MIDLSIRERERIDSSVLRPRERVRLMFRLLRHALPVWDKILLRIIISQLMALLAVLPALLSAKLVDEAFAEKDLSLAVKIALACLAVFVVSRTLWFIGDVMTHYMMAKIALNLKTRFYRHVQRLSLRFYYARPVGDHMFRCTRDVDDATFLVSEVIPSVTATLQRIAVLFFVLQSFGAWLLAPVLVYLLAFFLSKHWLATQIRLWDRRYRTENQRLDAVTREMLVAAKLVMAYSRARTAKRWYTAQAGRLVRMLFGRDLFLFFELFFNGLALALFASVIAVGAGTAVLYGSMTLGAYTAVSVLAVQLVLPFQDAISLFQLVRQRLVPAERMIETLDVLPDVVDPPEAKALPTPRGKVELRGVRFAYEDGGPYVLDGVDLVAYPGEKVAVVGLTGAGKTTLTNLLVRLYDASEGQVLIDDVNVRNVTQDSLRKHIGIVMQDTHTFAESVERNILYGAPGAGRDAMLEAARLACVDEFAAVLPNGYATQLAEAGALSGGQKQRLSLARAVVRDPKVLILDEATSALDPVTEQRVVENVDAAFATCTRIVVAHNLLSAKTANRIYVLDGGRVVESGTHDALMAAGGMYSSLWTRSAGTLE